MKRIDRRTLISTGASATLLAAFPALVRGQVGARNVVALSVDLLGTRSRLPENFLGLSYETEQLTRPRYFSASNKHLVELYRTLGSNGVLRLGGNTSEFAVWSLGGETLSVAEQAAPVGPDPGSHIDKMYKITPEAIDQLKTFLDATGWKLIYGINLGHNEPARAAAEALYIRQKIGSSLLAVQIGNEPDLYCKNGIRPATYGFADYILEWQRFVKEIREATPDIPLAGPDIGPRTEWVELFAKQAKDVRMLTSHYYAEGPPTDPKMNIDRLLHGSEKNKEATILAVAASKSVDAVYRMSEGNSCYHAGKQGVSDTFASALWAADYMLSMVQLGVSGVNFHGGGQGFYTPIAGGGDQPFHARPMYYAMLMFKEFAQGELVPVRIKTGDPSLSAFAAINGSGVLQIALVNKDQGRDITVAISTAEMQGGFETFALSAPSIDSTTNVTFGGSEVAVDGSWSPKQVGHLKAEGSVISVEVPKASAILLKATQPVNRASAKQLPGLLAGVVLFACMLLSAVGLAQVTTPVAPAQAQGERAAAGLQENVPYENVGGETLTADLYLPKGKGPYPAIVFVHGGAWRSGTRTQLRGQAALMAENGYFGMAIDYRLAPQHKFPAAFDDTKAAVLWLRQNAVKYNIDGDRIAIVGSSAGAHLAALLGTESTVLAPGQHRGVKDPSVSAVVAFNGIFDLATMPPSDKTVDFLGRECAVVKEICNQASPQVQAHAGNPPFLLLHGTADDTAPYAQAVNFQKQLQAVHVPVELFTAPGAPHTFWGQAKWKEPSFSAMKVFLMKVMPAASTH